MTLPKPYRVKKLLRQGFASSDRTFIIVDALNEYCLPKVSKQKELVRELETLEHASLLITSRNQVPYYTTSAGVASLTIRANQDDLRAFDTRSCPR